jgi:Mlc titration factor MtfA (ptsG expression regulator)
MAEITFRDLKNMRAFKELPILTLDQRWYQLMPEHKKTDEVRYWERRVNELLKKQGRVLEDIKDVENLKGILMDGIVQNMDETDEQKHKKRMTQSRRLIFEAKDKLDELRGKAEDVPTQLQRANQKLMIETVKACYNTINENEKDLDALDDWIEKTRVLLKKNLLIRQDKQDMNDGIYSGMHSLFGSELMTKMDRINEDRDSTDVE